MLVHEKFKEIAIKTIDSRTRITLGDLVKGFKRVKLYESESGEILLQPLSEIPASELWLYENKESLESVKKGLKEAAEGRTKKLDPDQL
ncbi:MAG: hypothetical protein ACMUIL_11210 [bacterium]